MIRLRKLWSESSDVPTVRSRASASAVGRSFGGKSGFSGTVRHLCGRKASPVAPTFGLVARDPFASGGLAKKRNRKRVVPISPCRTRLWTSERFFP